MTKIMENPKAEEERTSFTPGRPCRLTVRGYVIWSSTSCGLRPDQSVKTITWLSLKSGIASIGARSIAHRPQPAIPIQSITTRNLFRSESSIMRSIIVASPKTHGRIRARPQTEKRRTVSNLWAEIPQLSSNEEHFNQRHQCVVPNVNGETRFSAERKRRASQVEASVFATARKRIGRAARPKTGSKETLLR